MHNSLRYFFHYHCISNLKWRYFQEEKKKKKTVTEKYWDWELANETKPLWVS